MALRAQHWNTHMVSCMRYPAQLGLTDSTVLNHSAKAASKVFPRGYFPFGILPAVGIMCGVPGAPGCPRAAAHATTVITFFAGGHLRASTARHRGQKARRQNHHTLRENGIMASPKFLDASISIKP